jgi:hypothetical protein
MNLNFGLRKRKEEVQYRIEGVEKPEILGLQPLA